MGSYDALLIDPPMEYFEDETFKYGNLYQAPEDANCKVFNPGLLSIGSYIQEKGYSTKLIHILHTSEIKSKLRRANALGSPRMIAISCSYMHTYRPAIEIVNVCRTLFPNALILAGGEHIGNIPGLALRDCPALDIVVEGEGELATEKILRCLKYEKKIFNSTGNLNFRKSLRGKIPYIDLNCFSNLSITDFISENAAGTAVDKEIFSSRFREPLLSMDELPFVDYSLYENYLEYPVYIEESRGCYGNCNFCVSSIQNCYRYKSADRFLAELDSIIECYGNKNLFPFTAANFGVNTENTIKICNGIKNRHPGIRWSAEFRLDLPWENYIDIMYESGCTAFSIGLESASFRILSLMHKTRFPEAYVDRAEELIRKVASLKGATMHLNLMFYCGEDARSLSDNMRFISTHFNEITSVHYSPLILYSGTQVYKELEMLNREYGTSVVKNEAYDSMHAYPVNSSHLFSYTDACHFSRVIEKMFVDREGYRKYHEMRVSRDQNGAIMQDGIDDYVKGLKKE